MQRAGAAEGDEREIARIVAAPDGDQPDGVGHVGVGDLDDRRWRLREAQPERLGDAWRGSPARRRRLSSFIMPPASAGAEPPEDDVGVGVGRLVPPRP